MQKHGLVVLVTLAYLVFGPRPVPALSCEGVPLETLLEQSEYVAVGKVVDVVPIADREESYKVVYELREVLKGNPPCKVTFTGKKNDWFDPTRLSRDLSVLMFVMSGQGAIHACTQFHQLSGSVLKWYSDWRTANVK